MKKNIQPLIYVALGVLLGIVFSYFNIQMSSYIQGELALIKSEQHGVTGAHAIDLNTSGGINQQGMGQSGTSHGGTTSGAGTGGTTNGSSPTGTLHGEEGVGSIKDIGTAVVPATTTSVFVYVHTVPFVDCDQVTELVRIIPATTTPAHAVLTLLFQEDKSSLKDSYTGVIIKNGRAIVNFDTRALTELNSASCQQARIKTPIEKTLLQFKTIRAVDYAIDGVIKEDWDA